MTSQKFMRNLQVMSSFCTKTWFTVSCFSYVDHSWTYVHSISCEEVFVSDGLCIRKLFNRLCLSDIYIMVCTLGPSELVKPWPDHIGYKQISQSKVIRIYLPCDQKLTVRIVLSCCQSAASFFYLFCKDTVLPLTTLSGAGESNWQC